MLSDTYSKTDCQAKLTIDGFGTITDTILTDAFYEAKYFDIIPVFARGGLVNYFANNGEAYYDALAAIDKADYTVEQLNIYWAEVYFAMSRIAEGESNSEIYSSSGGSESISVEGYSRSVSNVSSSGKNKLTMKYKMKAYNLLGLAGYNPFKIQRS